MHLYSLDDTAKEARLAFAEELAQEVHRDVSNIVLPAIEELKRDVDALKVHG